MGDYTPKLSKAATDALEPGETLLAGVRGMSAGSTARIVGGAAGAVGGGAVGLVIADRLTGAKREAGEEAEAEAGLSELPSQLALGLTDRRLLVFGRGGLTGKPKDLVAFIPRDAVASITGEDSGSKLKPDRLTVQLTDGKTVDFEVVKNDDYRRVVEAFGA